MCCEKTFGMVPEWPDWPETDSRDIPETRTITMSIVVQFAHAGVTDFSCETPCYTSKNEFTHTAGPLMSLCGTG